MSFADLERGLLNTQKNSSSQLTSNIKRSIFKINSNTSHIKKLCTEFDSNGLKFENYQLVTKNMYFTLVRNEKLEETKEMIQKTTQQLKSLINKDNSAISVDSDLDHLQHKKIAQDFQNVVERFKLVQMDVATKSKQQIRKLTSLNETLDSNKNKPPENEPFLSPDNKIQLQELEYEADHNDALIIERENEIKNIERGIYELNDIFRDLGHIVNEQQGMLDNIESNVLNTTENVAKGNDQLTKANESMKKRRKTMMFFAVILIVIVFVILLIAAL